ncbi:MAG: diacylglyceryl transferase, partial [Sphingobacteriaceae bacterium]
QLSGDGDWGIVNNHIKPGWLTWLPDWAWSSRFPHNVINAGELIPGCSGNFCFQLPQGVYPTSLYEIVICTLIFAFLWVIRRHLRLDGSMFCIFLMLNGLERLLIEMIRVNPRYHLFNMAFTQAELISFTMVLGGVIGLAVILYRYSAGRSMKISG